MYISRSRTATTTPTTPPSRMSRPQLTTISLPPTVTPTRRMTNVASVVFTAFLFLVYIYQPTFDNYLNTKKDTELKISCFNLSCDYLNTETIFIVELKYYLDFYCEDTGHVPIPLSQFSPKRGSWRGLIF